MMTPEIAVHLAKLCQRSEFKKNRHGAVVLSKKNDILGVGWNKRKTHPAQKKAAIRAGEPNKEFLHAEIDAIIDTSITIDPLYAIVVGRLNAKGVLTYSKPCPVCMRAIKESGIKWLFYTGYAGELIKEKVV